MTSIRTSGKLRHITSPWHGG